MVEVSYLWMANDQLQLFCMSQVYIMKSTCTVTWCSAVPLTILLMCWVIIQLSWGAAVNPHTATVTLQLLLLAWAHCEGDTNDICDHLHFSCVHTANWRWQKLYCDFIQSNTVKPHLALVSHCPVFDLKDFEGFSCSVYPSPGNPFPPFVNPVNTDVMHSHGIYICSQLLPSTFTYCKRSKTERWKVYNNLHWF